MTRQYEGLSPVVSISNTQNGKPPKYGVKVSGLAKAALHLAEESTTAPFDQLKLQDVNAAGKDFLVATLDNAVSVKLAWADMESDSSEARESLRKQLTRLHSAIESDVAKNAKSWNATDYGTPGRIYATDPLAAEN